MIQSEKKNIGDKIKVGRLSLDCHNRIKHIQWFDLAIMTKANPESISLLFRLGRKIQNN